MVGLKVEALFRKKGVLEMENTEQNNKELDYHDYKLIVDILLNYLVKPELCDAKTSVEIAKVRRKIIDLGLA